MERIVACHSPVFMPWAGYFYKMMKADVFIYLDTTQMLRGRGVGSRNQIKLEDQAIYLSVPIVRLNGAYQKFKDVKIDTTQKWKKAHLGRIKHAYAKAPYFQEYFDVIKGLYNKDFSSLRDFNLSFIQFFRSVLKIENQTYLSSELNDKEIDPNRRLIELTKKVEGTCYLSGFGGKNYMNFEAFDHEGIKAKIYDFKSPSYPQLGKTFIPNLSLLDMIMNLGEKTKDVLLGANT